MIAIHFVHMNDKDFNLLRIFEALLVEHNVSRAARRLGLSQPALSHALSRLRTDFGDELFVRAARGVQPTPQALALAPAVLTALQGLRGVYAKRAAFSPKEAVGRIVLASTEFFEHMVLPRLLPALRKQAPGVVLLSRPTGGRLPKDEMERGDIDVAVAGFFGDLPEGFYRQPLVEDDFACILRQNHPAAAKALPLKAYLKLDHLLISPQGDLTGIVDKELARLGHKRRVVAGIANFLTPGWVIAASDLVLTAPRRLVNLYAQHLPLRILEVPLVLPKIQLVQVWHERTQNDPLHRFFRRLLQDAAAPEAKDAA